MTFNRQMPVNDSDPSTTTVSEFTWPTADPTRNVSLSGQQFYPLAQAQGSAPNGVFLLVDDDEESFWLKESGARMMFGIGVALTAVPVQKMLGFIVRWTKTKIWPQSQHDQIMQFQKYYTDATEKLLNDEVKKLNFGIDVASNLATQAATTYLNEHAFISDPQTLEAGTHLAVSHATQQAIGEALRPQIFASISGFTALSNDASFNLVDGACTAKFNTLFGGARSALITTYVEKAVAAELAQRAVQANQNRIADLANRINAGTQTVTQTRAEALAAKEALEEKETTTTDPAELEPLQQKLKEEQAKLQAAKDGVAAVEQERGEAEAD